MAFYKVAVKITCDRCKKRPTRLYEVKTSGSSPSWGKFCNSCADRRIRELTKTHGKRNPYG